MPWAWRHLGGGSGPESPFGPIVLNIIGDIAGGVGGDGGQTCAAGPELPFHRQLGAFALGFGDAWTFGLYSEAFMAVPVLGDVAEENMTLRGYEVGLSGGMLMGLHRLAYAGIAKGFGSLSGVEAMQARNIHKGGHSSSASAILDSTPTTNC